CAPNAGSTLAGLKPSRDAQPSFLASLSRSSRAAVLKKRKDVSVPDCVEFVCVVGHLRLGGDGLVALSSQWSEDLQGQGIPARAIKAAHWDAVKTPKGAEQIAKIALESHPRWKTEQVLEGRKKILGG